MPLDPFEVAELEAIEAALSGREVDPEHAELAELSVLLATDQQFPSEEFIRELDARVARRFRKADGRPRLRSWLWRPAFTAGLTAGLAAAVVVLVLHPLGGSPSRPQRITPFGLGPAIPPKSSHLPAAAPAPLPPQALHQTSTTAASSVGGAGIATTGSNATATPAPVPNGRRQIQSAQLTLGTGASRIDTVAQEVFNVVSRENGIVKSSEVTQGSQAGGDYANFNLSIPTSSLQETLDQLSQLQYAHVVSRTDNTQDVNNQYLSDQQKLADARALRTSLLKQLAAALTTTQVDSLEAQIHDAEASISSDEATLRSLQHQISFSSLSVQVNQAAIVLPAKRSSTGGHGLTLGRAAHDAGKVLTVAAGVILIGLAALVPVGLLVALLAWIGYWLRRRRREQALDAA